MVFVALTLPRLNASEPANLVFKFASDVPVGYTNQMAFSPNGRLLATLGQDEVLRFWDVESSVISGTFMLHAEVRLISSGSGFTKPNGLAFSSDGKWLATTSLWGCSLIDVERLRLATTMNLFPDGNESFDSIPESFFSVAFSPNSEWMCTGHEQKVRFWHIKDLDEVIRTGAYNSTRERDAIKQTLKSSVVMLDGHTSQRRLPTGVGPVVPYGSKTESAFISCCSGTAPCLWINSGNVWKKEVLNAAGEIDRIATWIDGEEIIVADQKSLRVVGRNGQTRRSVHKYPIPIEPADVGPVAATGGGKQIAFAHRSLDIIRGELQRARALVSVAKPGSANAFLDFDVHDNTVQALAVHPSRPLIASGGGNRDRLCIWDMNTGKVLSSIEGNFLPVRSVGYVGSENNTIAFGTRFFSPFELNAAQKMEYDQAWDFNRFREFNWGLLNANKVLAPLERKFDIGRLSASGFLNVNDSTYRSKLSIVGRFDIEKYNDLKNPLVNQDLLVVAKGKIEDKRIRSYNSEHVKCATLIKYGGGRSGVIIGTDTGSLYLQDYESDEIVRIYACETEIRDIAVSAKGNHLLAGCVDGSIRLFSVLPAPHESHKLGVVIEENSNRVLQAVPGGSAQAAGILAEDRILSVNGQNIKVVDDIGAALKTQAIGALVNIVCDRGGREVSFLLSPRTIAQPLVSLSFTHDGKWVAWTDKGYYACSPGADELFGWHANYAVDLPGRFFPASTFARELYRPDLVFKNLKSLGDPEQMPGGSLFERLTALLPPSFEITSHVSGDSINSSFVDLRAKAITTRPEDIANFTVMANGKLVFSDLPNLDGEGEIQVKVPLQYGDNVVSLQGGYGDGILSPPLTINLYCVKKEVKPQRRPKLTVLAAGVSDHQEARLKLNNASRDVFEVCQMIKQTQSNFFDELTVTCLRDQDVSREKLLRELRALKRNVGSPVDTVLVLLSGHGIRDVNNEYSFLTHEAGKKPIGQASLRWNEIYAELSLLNCRVFLLLDTCHAGAAVDQFDNLAVYSRAAYDVILRQSALNTSGVVTVASCLPHEASRDEVAGIQNSPFARALIEAFQGRADLNKNGIISISEFESFVSRRVDELVPGEQSTTVFKSASVPSNLTVGFVGKNGG